MNYVKEFQRQRRENALWEGSFSFEPKTEGEGNGYVKQQVKKFVAYRRTAYLNVLIGFPATIAASYLGERTGVPGLQAFLPAAIAVPTAIAAELYTGWMLHIFNGRLRQAIEDAKVAASSDHMMARLGVAYDMIRHSPVRIRRLSLFSGVKDATSAGTDGRPMYDPNSFDWMLDRLAEAGEICLKCFQPQEVRGSGNVERSIAYEKVVDSVLEKTAALRGRWCGVSVELAALYGLVAGYYGLLSACRILGFFV
jgi:hypothetical protein